MEQLHILLTIIGAFISMLLLVNAHFTRKTLEKISNVEIKLAVLIAKHDSTDEKARKNEFEIEVLKNKLHKLENKLQVKKGE